MQQAVNDIVYIYKTSFHLRMSPATVDQAWYETAIALPVMGVHHNERGPEHSP